MLPDLPTNVKLSPGRIEITADTAVAMVESLFVLAVVLQNDLDRFQLLIEPPPPESAGTADLELKAFLAGLRDRHAPDI